MGRTYTEEFWDFCARREERTVLVEGHHGSSVELDTRSIRQRLFERHLFPIVSVLSSM